MAEIIDIELLAKMPITKDFSELLFGEYLLNGIVYSRCYTDRVEYSVSYDKKTTCNIIIIIYENGYMINKWDYHVYEPLPPLNSFGIVRYIDNYLRSVNKVNFNLNEAINQTK